MQATESAAASPAKSGVRLAPTGPLGPVGSGTFATAQRVYAFMPVCYKHAHTHTHIHECMHA